MINCTFEMTNNVYVVWGRHDEAIKNYESILKYYIEKGDEEGRANTLGNLAVMHTYKGEYDEAIKNYESILRYYIENGDEKGRAEYFR